MSIRLQKKLGERVRSLRRERGMTQLDLAAKVRIHGPDLCDLEKGRHSPRLDTIEKLAKALDVSPAALLSDK